MSIQTIKVVLVKPVCGGGTGSGDVVGPASATDGNLAVFDGTTGKLIKDGGAPSGSNISVIDLGVVSAADAYREGIKILLPVVDGRVITAVRFLSDNFALDGASQVFFGSGNNVTGYSGAGSGFAKFGQSASDTIGLGAGSLMFGDSGPLGLVCDTVFGALPRTWTANTKYAVDDWVLIADHLIQKVTTGGTSGLTEPVWPTDIHGSTTVNDGTVVWTLSFDIANATATVHAIAEVVTIPGLVIPYPASLEWIQQPTDVVAGEFFNPEIQIQILDQNGNPFTNVSTLATRLLLYVLGAGTTTFGNPVSVGADPATGIVTFPGDSFGMDAATPAGTYQFVAEFRYDQLTISLRLDSDPFDVT